MNKEKALDEQRINEWTFVNLNIWRQAYIVLMWVVAIGMSYYLLTSEETLDNRNFFIGLAVYEGIRSLWVTWAIVKRNASHLGFLAFLSLLPNFNIISFIIILVIRNTTKKEVNATVESNS